MTYAAPLDDMRFVLNRLAGLPEIATLPGFEDADPELVEAILIEAGRFAGEVLAPLNSTGDRQGCRWFDGKVAKWNQWDFFRKCSLLIHHWPAIAARIKRGKAPAFRHIPLSWHEKAKLRKVSTDDPKKLKIES